MGPPVTPTPIKDPAPWNENASNEEEQDEDQEEDEYQEDGDVEDGREEEEDRNRGGFGLSTPLATEPKAPKNQKKTAAAAKKTKAEKAASKRYQQEVKLNKDELYKAKEQEQLRQAEQDDDSLYGAQDPRDDSNTLERALQYDKLIANATAKQMDDAQSDIDLDFAPVTETSDDWVKMWGARVKDQRYELADHPVPELTRPPPKGLTPEERTAALRLMTVVCMMP